MASISALAVQNIRSYQLKDIQLSPNVTVITGANGSGKTTLIEAVYIALQGSSFRGSDKDLLQQEKPWWKIDVILDDQKRTVSFDPSKTTGRKKFVIDGKINYRLPAKLKYPIVLFEPDDLRLLQGSPQRRRQFIDRFISQLNPQYGVALRKYERAMKQRNTLLKNPLTKDEQLFVWDISLSEHGAYIIEQRIAFIEKLNQQLEGAYQDISHTKDEISIHYSHTMVGDLKQKLLTDLENNHARDRITGSTSTGPHRHDLLFEINHSPALSVASRGEVRTIVLALKFIEVDIIEQLTGLKPIVLLDDVFSELDESRQKALSEKTSGHQIIITTTHTVSKKGFTQIRL